MDKRIMQLQLLNPHTRVFAMAARRSSGPVRPVEATEGSVAPPETASR